jgi:hypothetical protein
MNNLDKQVLGEYVKVAESLLHPSASPDSIEKLAMVLIESDYENALEKEAESVVYTAFAEELMNNGVDPLPILKELAKEVN